MGKKASGPTVEIRGREEFERTVLASELPVVVDFWAPWCAPCRAMAPAFEDVAAEWQGRVVFAKVDTERVPSVAAAFQISSIPTLLVIHQGEVVDVRIGASVPSALHAMAQRVHDRHTGVGFFDRLKRSLGLGSKPG